jgi:alpha 1,3-glucosidase
MRLTLLVAAALAAVTTAVKQEDFKQCHQSSFCRRLRALGTKQADAPSTFTSPYSLGDAVITIPGEASWTWPLRSSLYPEIQFELRVDVLAEGDGIVRVRADEIGSQTPFKRYNETAKWVLVNSEPPIASESTVKLKTSKGVDTIKYGDAGLSLEVVHSPLRITQLRNGKPEIVLNDRSLFHMEHFRIKEQEKVEEVMSEGEQMVLKGGEMDRSWFEEHDVDMFEEKWKQWTDSKPKGESGFGYPVDLSLRSRSSEY